MLEILFQLDLLVELMYENHLNRTLNSFLLFPEPVVREELSYLIMHIN